MRSPPFVAFALCIVGCSSSPVSNKDDTHTPTPPNTAVFDGCVDFATRLCADAEGCCRKAYGGFEPDGCLATFKRDVCRPAADAVMAGKASFNEESVDACLAAHAQAHAICTPTWQQTLELRREIYAACRVIDGTTEPGRGCAISTTCKHPDGDATADCVKNVCQLVAILPEGAECPFPSGSVSVCDAGLACDARGLGEKGHCVKAIATGQSCDGNLLESTECGLGSYCDPVTSKCQVAENLGGSGCSQSNECVSFECNRLANECAPAPAVVSRDTCLGPAPQP